MAEAETEVAPRRRLIIKLRLPRSRTVSSQDCKLKHNADSEKRGSESMASDSCGGKRKKDQCCKTTEYPSNAVGKSDAKGSRTLSTATAGCKLKNDNIAADSFRGGKRRKLITSEVSVSTESEAEHVTKSSVQEHHNAHSRIPRTGSKEKEEEGVECKKEEIVPRMDRYQKMQCWAILKRFMVGRDGWALKKPLDPKNLGDNRERVLLKPIGMEDIESKLNKFMYSGPDEFAKDVRLLFSYGLMYPQSNDIHRVAWKFSESFEITWKALMKKWSMEERKRNMILKRGRANNVIIEGRSLTLKKAT
ncbi:hypothetical protein PIB30_096104 [Stylosanthes scabra]|uniref:Bromo domain-containing protein n=2 Tax=Stylosanthes scabra TaxID=79078 RepID=A0ABU6VZ27_9FABA|nr:hypothetical protein [Stylosanthes scabra]